MKVDVYKNKDAAQLHAMLYTGRQTVAMLKEGKSMQNEYDRWRYCHPEFDATQRCAKLPSQTLYNMLVEAFKDEIK